MPGPSKPARTKPGRRWRGGMATALACGTVAALLLLAARWTMQPSSGMLRLPRAALPCIPPPAPGWLGRLRGADARIYAQHGEDGVIARIFESIGVTDKRYVEFGTQDGSECNTRALRELFGWTGLLMDGGFEDPTINLHQEFITPANINSLFAKYDVPPTFDLLSIDVDYDDLWVWKALLEAGRYRPRVVVIEYNGLLPANESRVVDPEDTKRWANADTYCGASLRALYDLGRRHGYTLVTTDAVGVNAFWVRSDILRCQGEEPRPFDEIFTLNVSPEAMEARRSRFNRDRSRQWLFLSEGGEVVRRAYLPV